MTLDTTIVITGASSGIGREAALSLAGMGARLALVGRDRARTESIAAETGGTAYVADFDRLDDVRQLAAALIDDFDRIDVLVNNAGGLVPRRSVTVDGFERTIQSNHLAPFLLTNLLLPKLIESRGRVVSTSSVLNRRSALRVDDLDWDRRLWGGGWRAYGTSKLATILFTEELARRTPITAYSFHPGLVATRFGHGSPLMSLVSFTSGGQYGLTAAAGAVPLIQLSSIPDAGAPSGTYFDTLTPNGRRHRLSGNAALARDLWEESARRTGIRP